MKPIPLLSLLFSFLICPAQAGEPVNVDKAYEELQFKLHVPALAVSKMCKQDPKYCTAMPAILKIKCGQNDLSSCLALANLYDPMYPQIPFPEKKMEETEGLYGMLCQKQFILCPELGRYYELFKQPSKALDVYKYACSKGLPFACTKAATLLNPNLDNLEKKEQTEISKDLASESFKYAKVACDLTSGKGCFLVGRMYLDGQGVKKKQQKAKEYIKKSCNFGSEEACKLYNKLF